MVNIVRILFLRRALYFFDRTENSKDTVSAALCVVFDRMVNSNGK